MGGNQHNNVVTALYEALGATGVTPHRFDFASSDPDMARAQTVAVALACGVMGLGTGVAWSRLRAPRPRIAPST